MTRPAILARLRGVQLYRDLLAAVDGAAKDVDRAPKTKTPAAVIVEVANFANGHEAPAP